MSKDTELEPPAWVAAELYVPSDAPERDTALTQDEALKVRQRAAWHLLRWAVVSNQNLWRSTRTYVALMRGLNQVTTGWARKSYTDPGHEDEWRESWLAMIAHYVEDVVEPWRGLVLALATRWDDVAGQLDGLSERCGAAPEEIERVWSQARALALYEVVTSRTQAALVLLADVDRVLVVRKQGERLWRLPGGNVKPGETPFQAAQRECEEEAGFFPVLDPNQVFQQNVRDGAVWRAARVFRETALRVIDDVLTVPTPKGFERALVTYDVLLRESRFPGYNAALIWTACPHLRGRMESLMRDLSIEELRALYRVSKEL